MRPRWTILALAVVAVIAAVVAARGQSIADKPTRVEAARFQLAYYLFAGHWNAEQKAFLTRGVESPLEARDMEVYARSLFTPDEAKAIFYDLDSIDLAAYKTVRGLGTFAAEQRYMVRQPIAARADLWRIKFADKAATLTLTRAQIEFLCRVSLWLNDPKNNLKEGRALLKESVALFDLATGRQIFGMVGTSWPVCGGVQKSTVAPLEGGQCPCNQGSYFNWSCASGSSCNDPNGGCSTTEDGCGFLGLWACNGNCPTSEIQ